MGSPKVNTNRARAMMAMVVSSGLLRAVANIANAIST